MSTVKRETQSLSALDAALSEPEPDAATRDTILQFFDWLYTIPRPVPEMDRLFAGQGTPTDHQWYRHLRRIRTRQLNNIVVRVDADILARRFVALAAKAVIASVGDDELFSRASGDCTCETCGLAYIDHPQSNQLEWLHVLCDGKLVKL